MIQIKHPNLDKLAARHWEAIRNYVQKINKLQSIDKKVEKAFPGYDFEKLVLAKPADLEHFIKNCTEKLSVFPKSYYSYLSGDDKFFTNENKPYRSKDLVNNLGIKVCPYCNRNFIRPAGERRIDELDHFYPKSKYPFLALSFYNLIPSCKTCNQTFKKEKIISVNPYAAGCKAKFKLKINNTKFYHSEEGFDIDFQGVEKELDKNFEVFHLAELYDQHKDIALEMIQKQLTYPDSYIDELFRKYEGTLFRNREDVLLHLSGNFVSEDDTGRRPLAKFNRDLAEHLDLIS